MNLQSSPGCRWVRYALVIGGLNLIGVTFPGEAAGAKKPQRKTKAVAKLVEAIASPNPPPKLVHRGVRTIPRFPKNYDWKKQKRVYQALVKLHSDTSVELWEELVRKSSDRRYSITVKSEQSLNSDNETVGDVCSSLAYRRLIGVFKQYMPEDPLHAGYGFRIRLHVGIKDLREWRKERKDKALYQLQIEVCERALKELKKIKRISKAEKDAARKKIEAEIKKLRRTKRPVIFSSNPFDDIRPPYSKGIGK